MKRVGYVVGTFIWIAFVLAGCSKDSSSSTGPQANASATLNGLVLRLGTTTPVAGVTVRVGSVSDTTDATGQYQLSLPAGSYQVSAVAAKYADYSGNITVGTNTQTLRDTIFLKSVPWEYVGNTIAIPGPTGWEFATGLNNTIYFATPNNTTFQQHFIAYDLGSNTYGEKSSTGNDLCACGYMSQLVAASNKLFYFANTGTVYTPATNAWTTANYPTTNRRGEAGVAVYGDDIYYVGGRGPLNTCAVYNVSTNAWKSIANYLYATDWPAAVAYNGTIYVLGGANSINKMSRYNPVSNSWTAMPDIPFANLTTRPRAVVFDNKIFFFSSSTVYVYDLLANSWSPGPMGTLVSNGIPVLAGSSMYHVGYSSAKSGYAITKYTP